MATGIPKVQWKGVSPPPRGPQPHGVDLERIWQVGKASANRLYHAENRLVLSRLASSDVRGSVRLIYIDPPYATNSVFRSRSKASAYMDVITGSRYLDELRVRLGLMRELLTPDGSIYVHLDDNMIFHAKILMDEIFGVANFRSFIVRKKCSSKNYTKRSYGNVCDYILFYTRSDKYVWNRPSAPWSKEHALREYPCVEETTGRRYKKVPVHAPGERNGETGKTWRGKPPPSGRHWKCAPRKLDELDARGHIYWSATGNPRKKVYLDESKGVKVSDLWLDYRDAHNQNVKITGYPTEKNETMLDLIVRASSNPGDLVLDSYCGSGTTLAAASQLGRRWIGIDESSEAVRASIGRLLYGSRPMKDVSKTKRIVTMDSEHGFGIYGDPVVARDTIRWLEQNATHGSSKRIRLAKESSDIP